eukprot:TRINITY_DN5665_c0_g1_i2.p1 TRINITY_DN5665_c0_g1~~TRINITY_DN5665_c0_g1_i2.p1  ORF type:complete len:271 (+),score=52.30 TRINITY_DN5665_c0_g1_i2:105-917(+)
MNIWVLKQDRHGHTRGTSPMENKHASESAGDKLGRRRSSHKKKSRHPRELVEAIPKEDHLARTCVERVDLRQELIRVKEGEADRHDWSMNTAPIGLVQRKCPYGAPLPQNDTGLMLRRRADRVAELRKQAPAEAGRKAEEAKAKQKRYPGLQPLDIPYDPTTLYNEHKARGEYLDSQIALQREKIIRAKSEATLRLEQSGGEVKAPPIHYDHLPPGTDITEAQAQFFPRSSETLKSIGSGKDSRFCRPMDQFYVHREMMFKQANAGFGKK